MSEDKKPPIYYVALHAIQATKQANLTQYKRKQAKLQEAEKQKQRRKQANEKNSGLFDVD
jgi:hypothetical protein